MSSLKTAGYSGLIIPGTYFAHLLSYATEFGSTSKDNYVPEFRHW